MSHGPFTGAAGSVTGAMAPTQTGGAPPALSDPPLAPVVGEVSSQPSALIPDTRPREAATQKRLVNIGDGSVGRTQTCQRNLIARLNSEGCFRLYDGNGQWRTLQPMMHRNS